MVSVSWGVISGEAAAGGRVMGKRSDYARAARDLYETPEGAVLPLLRHLARGTRFVEPCCGGGALVRVLEKAGHRCVGAYDLPDDARGHCYGVSEGQVLITNPPYWGRWRDLHPLILNLSSQGPCWLLMPADWLFNKSSGSLVRLRLRKIVAVGRVKWIAGSSSVGKENVVWLHFVRDGGPALFVGRG